MPSPHPTDSTANVDDDGAISISAVHPDIIQAHILTRLDGPTLASAGCASSHLHALSTQDKLWRDICTSTWPSINDPRVQRLIFSFPSGHRSFFSDSFPLLDPSSFCRFGHGRPLSSTSELISAVDIFYKDSLIFSKVQEIETLSGWFLCSPFRVDLLDPKESAPTPIQHVAGEDDGAWLKHLEENLTLSWIVIDPTRKRAANLSSRKAVSVQRHWLTGDVQLRYTTIMARGPGRDDDHVECAMVVTCGGKEGGKLEVREVSLQVEDMEGKHLSGRDSLGILESAIEGGKRKKLAGKGREFGKQRYEEYLEMQRQRKEKKARRERALDMACIVCGISMFVGFWTFLVFR
ncbi:F-box protein At2g27310 [Ziziphus jujuba]|uniref:F-box protein At2g27310 n=1 Tax=Ziziphus jujuba TaxID=326968 RepID=A0A6P3Z6P5_ZIZJJ|nr:F-box protein At2g27310 [Ziziphus jujuba]